MEGEKSQSPAKAKISSIRKSLPQILAVSVKNVLLLAFGMSLGFPTILIPSLSGGDPEEEIVLNQDAISWIGSVNLLCVPLGCLLSGFLTQPIGRRRSMQLVNLPFVGAWLLFHFAKYPWHVFLASCITGVSGGLLEAPTLTYLAEVTTPNLRGVLASTSTVAVISGILIQFLLGTFLHWRSVALVSAILPITSCILLFLVPESPYWLISKNRLEDAQKSIAWLKGWLEMEEAEQDFKELYEQLKKNTENERAHISTGLNSESKFTQVKNNLKLYTKKNFLWPFGLVTFTFGLGHFSGMTTLQTYAVNIFTTLKAPIDKYYATIMLGVAEALGCILSSTLVHFTGKRKMNFVSLIGTGLCFFIVATYAQTINVTKLQTAGTVARSTKDEQNWLPMTFLVTAAFFSHAGIRILPWMLIGEVYYSKIRAPASGFSGAASYILGFISNKIFFSMISVLTLPGTFWFYSFVALLGFVALYFWLPETEGKTLFQITEHFGGGKKLDRGVNHFIKMRRLKKKGHDLENQSGETNAAFDGDIVKQNGDTDVKL
ncbi:facilitated trehalose transporter Tret1-like [Euwallacea similis]|uniref:facilitated trehalose transporter Tret1-like n=1 Tax=Euwallacea similis TaxID=1736056 RepID=UPI00344F05DA